MRAKIIFLKNLFSRLLIVAALLYSTSGYTQQYILNQGFTNASGTTPPAGWSVEVLEGDSNQDVWHFDNPGSRYVSFPITGKFAIFDAGFVSPDNTPQKVALQSSPFNASGSNFFILMFDHTFIPGQDERAVLEVNYGDGWREIAVWDEETSNPRSEVIDVSPTSLETGLGEALKASMIRFLWDGNGQGFWALDNVRIYQAYQYDAALLEISSPDMPFDAGEQEIRATLGNFGTLPIAEASLHWAINDEAMGSVTWNGNLHFGQKEEDIIIGTYDFQTSVRIKVWVSLPPGFDDGNSVNNINERLLRPALSGIYTVGGDDSDFHDFKEAADALNTAGVNGPVRFIVRPGSYQNQITIGEVTGTNSVNTITFESENEDPESTELSYTEWLQATMHLRGTKHIHFKNIGFFGGYNGLIIDNHASDVSFVGCLFRAGHRFAVNIRGGSNDILLEDNMFNERSNNQLSDTALVIGQMGYVPVTNVHIISNSFGDKTRFKAIQLYASRGTIIEGNSFNNIGSGISSYSCEDMTIRNNRMHIIGGYGYQSAAIELWHTDQSKLYNNFIYTRGSAPSSGIRLRNANSSEVLFNSINITNTDVGDRSTALEVKDSDQLKLLNNIFNINDRGLPVMVGINMSGSQIDYNNYHHPRGIIGNFEGVIYSELDGWRTDTGQDNHSLSVNPFYTSPQDLSINQILLNNAALAIAGIDTDIDGVQRHLSEPDIGAKEYDPCTTDAGLNRIIAPSSPVEAGTADIRVELQNQGTALLEDLTIHWSVNGIPQNVVVLSGQNMVSGANKDILLGTFEFSQVGFYDVRAWTNLPNDCNHHNDSIRKLIMVSGALCNDYYIGDQPGDHFSSFSQAVLVLHTSGVGNCPVRFLVRGGEYHEQLVIGDIQGTSTQNLVTFEAHPDNDSPVQLLFPYDRQTPVRLSGASNIVFRSIEFQGHYGLIIENQSSHILLENCSLSADESFVPARPGLVIRDGSNDITLRNNTFVGGSQSISLEHGSKTVQNVNITGNTFSAPQNEALNIQSASQIDIANNYFDNVSFGVKAVNTSGVTVWANRLRLQGQYGQENIGIHIQGGSHARVYNNYILGWGQAASVGIKLNSSQHGDILFNSIHIANDDPEGNNKALWLINGTSHKVKNNIFMVRQAGNPVHLQGTPSQLTIDFNNYYSSRGRIGRHNQSTYNNMDDWRSIISGDDHSLSVNPFFPPDDGSQVDLSMNQVLLKHAGLPVDGIVTDIAGNLRDGVKPDIGAKETNLCTYDAGINAILSPGTVALNIPGGQEIKVLLQNHGTESLFSVDVFIRIVGAGVNTVHEYSWVNADGLPGGNSTEVVFDETFNYYDGLYTVKAWTDSPNGQTDCNHYNDSTEISVVASLCGTAYTIGGQNPDFLNFSDAIAVLNTAGITCPVVFNVRDDVYEERFVIGNIPGADADNTVSFIAENGSDANVIIYPETGEQAAVVLRDAHNIEFRHIEFVGQYAVAIADQSGNILIDGCSFNTRRIAIELDGTGTNNIQIINNSFSGIGDSRSSNYIMIHGNSDVFSENVLIKNNVFNELLFQALHITAAKNITIEENHFDEIQMGILAVKANNLVVNSNWLTIISSADRNNMGVTIEGGEDIDIYNNFINSSGTHTVNAIYVSDALNSGVYFNTINVRNSNNGSKALWLQEGASVVVKNNILYAPAAYPIYIDVLPQDLVIDYNNYYNANGLIGYNGMNMYDHNTWETSIGGDSNSSYFDPLFTSYDFPLPYEKFLNGAGETLLQVTHDIYGLERNDPPDIGCMEFFIDYGLVDLVAPLQQCSFAKEEEISVVIKRYGDIPLESFDISLKINDGNEHIEPVDGYFEGVYTHTFSGTFDLSDYKTYEITIRLLNVNDDNQNNDHGSYVLVQPKPVNIESTIVHETCAGREDGSIKLDIAGGVAPYTVVLNGAEQNTLQNEGVSFVMENLNYGTYNFLIVDKLGCEEMVSIDIHAAELLAPVIYATNDHGIIYSDSIYETIPFDVEFSFTVNDEDMVEGWLWRIGTVTETTVRQPKFSFEEQGVHEVILEVYSGGLNDCMEQTSFTINIEIPELSLDVEMQPRLCADDNPSAVALTILGGLPPFTVIFNGDTLQHSDRDRYFSYLDPGDYTISVEDSFGQSQTVTKTIPESLSMNPVIYATDEYGVTHTDTIYGVVPFDISFAFNVEELPAFHIWYYDHQSFDNVSAIPITVNEEGITTIFLEVHSGDPYNCIELAEFIIVAEQKVVIIPVEVITPDGGGPHAYFEVISKGLVSLDVDIYDRRGRRVHGYTGLDGKWFGDYDNGQEAPDGMYTFYLRSIGFDGRNYELTGLIRLIREAANLFPNPASHSVQIDVGSLMSGPVQVEIINYKGERILYDSKPVVDKLVTLDVSGLVEGVYLVRLSGDTRVISKKLIIARP